MLEIQDKTRLTKRLSNQVLFKFTKTHDDRVSNRKSQKGKGTSSPSMKPTCGKWSKKHYGDCLVKTDNYIGCRKSGHEVKDFPNLKRKYKVSGQYKASCSNVDS